MQTTTMDARAPPGVCESLVFTDPTGASRVVVVVLDEVDVLVAEVEVVVSGLASQVSPMPSPSLSVWSGLKRDGQLSGR